MPRNWARRVVVNGNTAEAVEAIKQATAGAGVDFSIDATGSPHVLAQAVSRTCSGGTCALVEMPVLGAEVALPARTVRGIIEGESVPDIFLPRLIELWRQGRFPVNRIITHYDFDRIDTAAHDADTGRVINPVLRM